MTRKKYDRAKRSKTVSLLVAIALILGSTGLVTGGIWFSIQLFINPNAVSWVNSFLPKGAQIPVVQPEFAQTLTQIQASIKQLGQIPGDPLPLETKANPSQPTSYLLPVLERQPNCQNDCERIVELRLYQPILVSNSSDELYYQLADQETVEGIDEASAIAPLAEAGIASYASNRPLPLTELHQFTGNTPTGGIWLYLLGEKLQGNNAIAYGQIVHYNPETSDLSLILRWTSPTGRVPQWQQVTKSNSPELVIDETVDLEPRFSVYQIKAASATDPIQLQEISLLTPALNHPAYQDALFLARNGLWSPAWKWLQAIEQQQRKSWSAAAQAQMDLIHMYAQFTQNQAEQTWASPSQQVLADLIDGRWGEALQVFQASAENAPEFAAMLQADKGQVWDRVEAALQVNPDRPEVLAWGVLLLSAQSGKNNAITWLKQQPKTTKSTFEYVERLLKLMENDQE